VFSDEIYLSETSISFGGVGCACWDGAIILARWLLAHGQAIRDAVVHEVGAGVGLPGIAAARFAKRVTLSDYVPVLIECLNYNIRLNGANVRDATLDELEQVNQELENLNKSEADSSRTQQEQETAEVAGSAAASTPEVTAKRDELEKRKAYMLRRISEAENVMRVAQAKQLDWLAWDELDEAERESYKCDVILGTEVSYVQNAETLDALLNIVNKTLNDKGVFYLVQSDDRGTDHRFIPTLTEKYGFELTVSVVPDWVLQLYRTGQLLERYLMYTFSRPGSQFPKMSYPETYEEFLRLSREQTCSRSSSVTSTSTSDEGTISSSCSSTNSKASGASAVLPTSDDSSSAI